MIRKLFGLVFKTALLFVLAIVAIGFVASKGSRERSPELAAAPAPAPAPAPPSVVPPPAIPPAGPATPEELKPGTKGVLALEGEQAVWMAKSEPDYQAMFAAEKTLYDRRPGRPAGGGAAIYRLAQAKRVTAYAVGTRVRVLKNEGTRLVVEVIAGEDKGERGWVQREMVTRGK